MTGQVTARTGKKLGRYRIERELGRGGMGVVYVAEDEHTGRHVALKTTSIAGLGGAEKSRNQRRQRFVREVKALTQVSHPNVVHVIDAGEADDPDLGWLLFYSMEYVEGETLAQLVQRTGPLAPGAAAAVVLQVASGLGAAHASGIVHRDVKPANIFISHDGRALIGDFGICKIEGQTQITRRDQVVGTPNYLAPEQILGDPVSPATDVFALGALFYIVTMNRPLRSQVDAPALLRSAQGNEPRERMLAERSVPEGLRHVIARCLERDHRARFANGSALAEALADHATRIPALSAAPSPALMESSSTGDHQNLFASKAEAPAEPDAEGFANPDDVEAAARAMLAEVSQRKASKSPSGTNKVAAPPPNDDPLPVAQTESTVMFNLRALQEQERGQEAKPLPVARTESTVVFQMRGLDGAPARKPPPVASSAVAPVAAAEPASADVEPVTPQPPTGMPGTSVPAPASARGGGWGALRDRITAIPRATRVGLSAASGAALGIALVLILAPVSTSRAGGAEAPTATRSPLERPRPAMCPESIDARNTTSAEQEKAAGLLQKARKLEADGAQTGEILELLERALDLNPLEAELYFELARSLLKSGRTAEADQAYDCVCFVSSTHPKCERVMKLREQERTSRAP